MQLRTLSRRLNAAFRDSDLARRQRALGSSLDLTAANDTDAESDHAELVREYYEICTEFMVFGWSESLHFAPLSPRESLEESQIRHQRLMIERLELQPEMSVIDVGCGVGGPMRRVVHEAGVRVLGVNNNEPQLERAKSLNAAAGIVDLVEYLHASFMDMSAIKDDTFDRAYAIESTCHAPDKVGAFSEIYRVLQPGALFWGQEMCLTDRFDPDDRRHEQIKRELMRGIALKEIATTHEVDRALEAAGFELIEGRDRAVDANVESTPWYQPMQSYGGTRAGRLLTIPLGRQLFLAGAQLATLLGIFPRGSGDVIKMMDRTAQAYVAGGQTGIFTPLYCVLARKPLTAPPGSG